MPRRILILDEDVGNLNIKDLLEAHHVQIVNRASAASVEADDVVIVPVWQRYGTLEEVLGEVHRRKGSAVVFADGCDDQGGSEAPYGSRSVTGALGVRLCAEHHCNDIILGNRAKDFLRSQVHVAIKGRNEPGHEIAVSWHTRSVFLAVPYNDVWANRCQHYLIPCLEQKGLTPCCASDTVEKDLHDNIKDSDIVIAAICDAMNTHGDEERSFNTPNGVRPNFAYNMNVAYEAGVAMGMGRQVALVLPRSCSDRDIPGDFRRLPRIHYRDDLELALEVWRRCK